MFATFNNFVERPGYIIEKAHIMRREHCNNNEILIDMNRECARSTTIIELQLKLYLLLLVHHFSVITHL